MSRQSRPPPRCLTAACLLATLVFGQFSAPASGRQTLSGLKDRLTEIQAQLDEKTAAIEELRTQEANLQTRIAEIEQRMRGVQRRRERLEARVVEAAQNIYRSGGTEVLEALLTSSDFAELASRVQYMNRVAERDQSAFVDLSRAQDELAALMDELSAKSEELAATRTRLAGESERLQEQFEEAADEYEELKRRLAAAARREAARREAARREATSPEVEPVGPSDDASPSSTGLPPTGASIAGGITCPVAGPNSFIDSWGFPRSGGRTHEGTDIMAALGTAVVAIRNGTVTYAGYGASAGNWIILSGDDGTAYWYMHNQGNLVSGGRVSAGQQIATVGNTGNAAGGPPHVHFEYHPGGGGPINPYPLLSGIC